MTMDWNPDSRCSFGISTDALDELDAIADDEGVSRSEKLRELVRKEIERKRDVGASDLDLPAEPRLAEAYKKLYDSAYEPHKATPRVSLRAAESELYSNEVSKEEVLRKIIKPLEKRGYVTVHNKYHETFVGVREIRQGSGSDEQEVVA